MLQAVCIQGKKLDMDRARRLADQFQVDLVKEPPQGKDAMYFLLDRSGLSLVQGKKVLKGDLTNMLSRVTGGHLAHEILLKAAKPGEGRLRGVDATAGMGEDALILAAAGYEMELFEHNPITAALLQDSLWRARKQPDLKDIVARMKLTQGDSKDLLAALTYEPDLIYLDPMFPEKKKGGETKKKLQMLHQIEAPCADEEDLVQTAIQTGARKIVIKRPPEGPFLAGLTPSYQVTRKAVRFDCLVFS